MSCATSVSGTPVVVTGELLSSYVGGQLFMEDDESTWKQVGLIEQAVVGAEFNDRDTIVITQGWCATSSQEDEWKWHRAHFPHQKINLRVFGHVFEKNNRLMITRGAAMQCCALMRRGDPNLFDPRTVDGLTTD